MDDDGADGAWPAAILTQVPSAVTSRPSKKFVTRPPAPFTMAMSTELTDMAKALGLEGVFLTWCGKQKVLTPVSFARCAATEEQVFTIIVQPAKEASALGDTMGDKSNVVSLWFLARRSLPVAPGSVSSGVEEGIPKESRDTLDAAWKSTHKFTLPDAYLLVCSSQKKLRA